MNKREPFTTSLRNDLLKDLAIKAASAGMPRNTIIEDALQLYWGSTEPLLQRRREMVLEAFKTAKRAA